MPKIGVVLALDGEQKFAQAMKNAQQASRQLDSELKSLKSEFKDSASSMEYLTKKQDLLKQKEEAYQRTLTAAKTGQSNAKKAYKEQAQALEELEKELKQAQEALSKMSSSDTGYAKQAKEVERLSAAVDKQTANYLKAEGRLSSWDSKVNKAQSDIRKNSTALEKNAGDMQKSSSEAGRLANSMDDISREADDASASIKNVGVSLGTMAKAKAVDLAGDAIRELGQKAVEAAKFAVEVGSEFEASMSEVEAISGASGNSLDQLSDKAKKLGRSTKFSASEVAQAYKYMGMAGWNAGQMISGVDGILNLAAASGEELATTSDIVTDDLTAFGMAADQAGRMADVLAAASTSSNTNVSLLGETFKYAGAVAGSFGYTLEDVSIAAGLMANAGIKGTQAGTALRSIFTRLATDAGASSTKLGALGTLTEKLGVQFYKSDGSMRDFKDVLVDMRGAWSGLSQEQQTNYAKTIAGQNALSGFLALMNAEQGDFDKLSSAIENSSGAAEKMAGVMQDNLKGAMTEFGSAAEGLGIAVYNIFDDALTEIVDLGTRVANSITDALTPDTQQLDDYMQAVRDAQAEADGITISPKLDVMELAEDDPTGLQEYLTGILESGDAISELALDPDLSGLQGYIDEVRKAGENLNKTREAANAYIGETINQAAVIGALGDRLIKLNGIEDKSNTQRYEMRTLVQELSQFIPELADAYDEESGTINMQTKEVEALIKAKQRQMIVDAQAASQQEVVNKLYEAEANLMKAEEARAAAWENRKAAVDQAQYLRDIHQEYNDLTDVINGVAYATDEEREAALIRRGEISKEAEALGILVTSETSWQDAIADSEVAEQEAIAQHHDAYDAWRTLRIGVQETTEELRNQPEVINRVLAALGLQEEAAEDVAEAEADVADATNEATEAVAEHTTVWDRLSDALKNTDLDGIKTKILDLAKIAEEAKQKAKEQAKAVANAFKDSSDAVKDAWQNLQDAAKQTLTISIDAEFDGGSDLTTEQMNANLQSQLEGYRNYVENLAVLRQAVAEGIITPEFFTHLEEQGTSAANEIQHMAWTLNNQANGEEELRGISDKWTEALDMQDQISLIIAGDQAALADGLKSMGSSDKEFDALQAAIGSGFSAATDTVRNNVNDLAETARAVGAKIPEGLTEAISNGTINATAAKEQLEASITGAMSGLADIAEENGVDISSGLMDSLSEAIESGDYTAITNAYNQMISSLSDVAVESSAADDQKAAGEDAGNAYAEGIESSAEAAGEAAEAIKEAVTEKLTEVTVFTDAGTEAAEAFAEGLTGGTETVQEAAQGLAQAASDAIHAEAVGSVETLMATGKAIGTTVTGAIGTEGAEEAGGAIADAVKDGIVGKVTELQADGTAIGTTVSGAIGTDEAKTAGENIADAVKSGIAGKSQTLQSAGSAIGTTVGGGIGTDAANTAGGDIAQEVINGIATKVDKLQAAGGAIADNVLTGMTDNSDVMETAGKAIAESIITGAGEDSNSLIETGKAYTNVIKSGMVQGVEEGDLGGTLSGAINDGVATKASELETTGKNIASAISGGIIANSTSVHSAAVQLANMAKIAAGSNASEFNGVGINMAAGVASGIASGQSNAINAAANMAAQALAAAKRALDIKSPSKKFQKEVGHQITKGMAFGIRQNANAPAAEAEKMSQKTLSAASAWLNKYEKTHKQKTKTRLENERYFWQQVANVTKKGTDAYYTAMAKSGFGVSWYKTTGSGKNKKTVKKDAETYYGEVYSAAQDFFDRLTMNQDMSIKSELAYWQKVQSGLKKGTTAYVQAAQKIKSIKEKIGGFDVAADILDSFQIYQEMSEKAVMDYWDLIRRQYETGTEDRMKADEKYLDAKKRYNEKLKDLEQDYADAVADKNRELAEAIEDRVANIAGAYDLFEEYTSEAASGQDLLFNIRSQAEGYKFWREQLQALEARGILSAELMSELSEKGPNESAAIYALNSLSDDELAAYNLAYQQKMDMARLQATEDEKDLAAKISDEIESLTDEYSKQVSATNENLNSQMASLTGNIRTIASDQTAQIVAAIVNQGATAQQAVAQVQQQQASTQAAAQAASAAQAAQAAQQAELQKKILQDKIMSVVSEGKKTSKTNSDYGQLRNYVISKFGYDIGSYQNNNTLYQRLGKILGVSVNKTATGPQRTAILNALKAAGFRRGTRHVPVWMDEDGPGSEMVVSRADNAILTRVPADSSIFPANLTDNLWQWGSFAPAQFLAQMERRQAAMTAYVERMVGSTISMAGLNNRLATVNAVPVSGGGFSGEGLLQRMFDLMAEYLPHIEDSRNTYLDKDLVTKSMSDNMSREMALRSRRVRQ